MAMTLLNANMNRATWHVVWCCERCFKDENKEQREILQKTVEACGGSLICMRKAPKFAQWLEKQTKREDFEPYVLVTDWREAKPSLNFIVDMQMKYPDYFEILMPVRMFVGCEGSVLMRRATQWVNSLQGLDFKIDAVDQDQLVSSMVEVAPRYATPTKEEDELKGMGLSSKLEESVQNDDVWSKFQNGSGSWSDSDEEEFGLPDVKVDVIHQNQHLNKHVQTNCSMFPSIISKGAWDAETCSTRSGGSGNSTVGPSPLADSNASKFLANILGSYSVQQVEQMLLAAAPDRYHD